jgi:hypothetical protein
MPADKGEAVFDHMSCLLRDSERFLDFRAADV